MMLRTGWIRRAAAVAVVLAIGAIVAVGAVVAVIWRIVVGG